MDLDGIYYGEGLTLLLLTGVAWSEMLEDVHLSRNTQDGAPTTTPGSLSGRTSKRA
jgi:hypothetical protein